jgi:hypothetical protein
MIIKKRIQPEFFEMILKGEKRFELRLADFELNMGDKLILEEQDQKTGKPTGRKIEKECKGLMKINPTKFHDAEEIKKHGFYVIECD